jgi:UDP-N-acetyl-2-amino-2-deoxyglucuronate dehydrogenase
MKNFGLIGAAGYVAPRHLRAIRDTGNRLLAATDPHDTGHNLVAAVDPHDAVGILDRFSFDVRYFTEIERFDRHLEKLRRQAPKQCVQYLAICSPSYLHDAHVRLALRLHAHAICEKPLVINPWNVDALAELEAESDCRVYTVLQLRAHPSLVALEERLATSPRVRAKVRLTYITPRGPWYHVSWKGEEQKSGGIVVNIGIHFFDVLLWLFGAAHEVSLQLSTPARAAGTLELEWASVQWFLSVDPADLPPEVQASGEHAHRRLSIDDEEINLSDGFGDLHTRVYQQVLGGQGLGLRAARPAIELSHRIRRCELSLPNHESHPLLRQ